MARKIRTFSQEQDYTSQSLPSIERRSLMESGMRRRTTTLDVVVVVLFFVGLIVLLGYFLTPVLAKLIAHLPDVFRSTGS